GRRPFRREAGSSELERRLAHARARECALSRRHRLQRCAESSGLDSRWSRHQTALQAAFGVAVKAWSKLECDARPAARRAPVNPSPNSGRPELSTTKSLGPMILSAARPGIAT